jgi:hypothetical protein
MPIRIRFRSQIRETINRGFVISDHIFQPVIRLLTFLIHQTVEELPKSRTGLTM